MLAKTLFRVVLAGALAHSIGAIRSPNELHAMQRDAQARRAKALTARSSVSDASPREVLNEPKRSTVPFSNPEAQKYHVDGKKIPDVDFDAGDSWAGLMPISAKKGEKQKLFFWFWPSKIPQVDDLVLWTNGGPGCSSLIGLLEENGPFKWPPGTAKPIPNQWSWTNLTNVLWVEQPVGTGFSQGTPDIHDDDELAAQLAGFLVQFLEVFKELKGKNFYLSGESYAGYYVPYIANYLYEHPGLVPLNTKGIWITDPTVSYDIVTEYIPAYKFAEKWKKVFGLNDSYLQTLKSASDSCGFTDYAATYATYPPRPGPFPLPSQAYLPGSIPNSVNITSECLIQDDIYNATLMVNPTFNIYRIFDVWPPRWDVLGTLGSSPNSQSPTYFARKEVQNAIHAPNIEWNECTRDVFVNGQDNSVPSMLSVMPNVIEKSERTVVMHGLLDFLLIAEGTRIAIQNMTWGGLQGFQTPIVEESFVIKGFGAIGNLHQERNLTYVEVNLAGHMMPEYSPWAAYKTLWYLLGRGSLTSDEIDDGLYPNNYQFFGQWSPPPPEHHQNRFRGMTAPYRLWLPWADSARH
ncbi:alpha/beta-hydrolase [Cantharellus anzutake]|uniref:alpha/beta-hydrolase n=1 Tax=Cantharellus anzutake TaxID=1750568 RepID=UPI001906B4ED|nr:alpha/beta-hydrolase [Cantharellus anzutake]KAF8335892.1 alpha/beta-hydrolase [Cantharellus anzutake]